MIAILAMEGRAVRYVVIRWFEGGCINHNPRYDTPP